jgi:hypothetical protein
MRKTLLLLAAAALSLTACQFQEAEKPETGQKSVLFHALADMPTRTVFGEGQNGYYPTYWTDDDTQVKLALGYTEPQDAQVTPSEDGLTATFAATLNPESTQAPYVVNAFSPASAVQGLSPEGGAWEVVIPDSQTPLSASVDESAMLLWARSLEASELPDEMDLTFKHLTAYILLSITNIHPDFSYPLSVEISSSTPLAGYWRFNFEDGSLNEIDGSHTIFLDTHTTENLWIACAPADLSGQTLTFTVNIDDASLVKEVQMPQDRVLRSGRVARLNVDFSGIVPGTQPEEQDFYLLMDPSLLQPGDKVIIANQEGTYGLGEKNTGGATPYRQAVPITVNKGMITDRGEATVLTLAAGSSSGTWAFKAPDGYLSTSTVRNSMTTVDAIQGTSSWSISLGSSGDATIMAQEGTCNYMRYNYNKGSYSRFSAYASNSSLKDPVAIYRQGYGGEPSTPEDLITAYTDYGYYFSNASRSYLAGKDQYSREYDLTGGLTFALLNPTDKEQVEIAGFSASLEEGDAVTISVNHRKGTKVVFSGTYPLEVVKMEGSKVWLGNGAGNGVIIKK